MDYNNPIKIHIKNPLIVNKTLNFSIVYLQQNNLGATQGPSFRSSSLKVAS